MGRCPSTCASRRDTSSGLSSRNEFALCCRRSVAVGVVSDDTDCRRNPGEPATSILLQHRTPGPSGPPPYRRPVGAFVVAVRESLFAPGAGSSIVMGRVGAVLAGHTVIVARPDAERDRWLFLPVSLDSVSRSAYGWSNHPRPCIHSAVNCRPSMKPLFPPFSNTLPIRRTFVFVVGASLQTRSVSVHEETMDASAAVVGNRGVGESLGGPESRVPPRLDLFRPSGGPPFRAAVNVLLQIADMSWSNLGFQQVKADLHTRQTVRRPHLYCISRIAQFSLRADANKPASSRFCTGTAVSTRRRVWRHLLGFRVGVHTCRCIRSRTLGFVHPVLVSNEPHLYAAVHTPRSLSRPFSDAFCGALRASIGHVPPRAYDSPAATLQSGTNAHTTRYRETAALSARRVLFCPGRTVRGERHAATVPALLSTQTSPQEAMGINRAEVLLGMVAFEGEKRHDTEESVISRALRNSSRVALRDDAVRTIAFVASWSGSYQSLTRSSLSTVGKRRGRRVPFRPDTPCLASYAEAPENLSLGLPHECVVLLLHDFPPTCRAVYWSRATETFVFRGTWSYPMRFGALESVVSEGGPVEMEEPRMSRTYRRFWKGCLLVGQKLGCLSRTTSAGSALLLLDVPLVE
uniref:Uncharacterized protein n=1 Tax=Mycena chlorophos TaxID=658473 RepID=A0ABQ0LFS7_MYCCL|nr:predicted protein [Mycena chlorophos]